MDKIVGSFRWGIILLALGGSIRAADYSVDPRPAKVRDTSDTESKVSGLTLTNVDLRFGLDPADYRGRVFVATETYQLAIPLVAISNIVRSGNAAWTIQYQTRNSEARVEGGLLQGKLAGNSDLGQFGLPLNRLDRLDYFQPAQPTDPAKRPVVYGEDGRPRPANFDAVLTLTDGTHLHASQLRRNQVFALSVSDPTLLNVRPTYALVCTNFTDFRLLRGETLQTIPFENVQSAQFMPDGEVSLQTRSGDRGNAKSPATCSR